MFQQVVLANIWDIVDAGIDRAVDEIQSVGATGVCVVVGGGPVAQLRHNSACTPRFFRDAGGIYFRPDMACYADARIKPITSAWLRQRNPLDQIAEATDKRCLQLRLRISAFETGTLAHRHPEVVAKSVFGEPAAHRLCPAHPEVRALVRSMVTDLAERYVPAAIEIDGLHDHSGTAIDRIKSDIDLGSGFAALWGLCFAEASRQWAVEHDADPAPAARWVETKLAHALDTAQPIRDSLDTLLADAAPVRRYVDTQILALDTLLESVAPCAGATELAVVLPLESGDLVCPSKRSIATTGSVVCALTGTSGDALDRAVAAVRKRVGHDVSIIAQLPAARLCAQSPQALVRIARRAADARLAGIMFSHWGALGDTARHSVRQAARFATRSTV